MRSSVMVREDGLVVPGSDVDELLERLGVAAFLSEGHRCDGLPPQIEQLSRQIVPGRAAPLGPALSGGAKCACYARSCSARPMTSRGDSLSVGGRAEGGGR